MASPPYTGSLIWKSWIQPSVLETLWYSEAVIGVNTSSRVGAFTFRMGILIFTVFTKSQIWLIFSLSEKQFSVPDEDQWSNLDLTKLPKHQLRQVNMLGIQGFTNQTYNW